MNTVKLQILLKRPMGSEELDKVEQLLGNVGATVTARGAVTLSATVPAERFEKVFAKPFKGQSGFVSAPESASTLPIPADLTDYIESISETPRHVQMK
jgi:hypothetical protein